MPTTRGTEADLVKALNNIIELDFDAIEAYRKAIESIDNDDTARSKLGAFLQDHERHTRNLAPFVQQLGGTPATEADYKAILTKGKVAMAKIMGDRAVLMAMKTNEDETNMAYEQVNQRDDIDGIPGLRDTLRQNLADERRHREWIETRIRALEATGT